MTATPRTWACLVGFAAAVSAVLAPPSAGQPPVIRRFDADPDWANASRWFKPFSVRGGRSVTLEPDGVVLATDAANNPGPFGTKMESTIQGDFQMDVVFDLEEFPQGKLAGGYGLVVGIFAEGDAKTVGSTKTGRSAYPHYSPAFHAGRHIPLTTGKTHYATSRSPTGSMHGRLGLRRVGREMLYLASETPDGELLEWVRYPFTREPVRVVGMYLDTGGAAVPVKATFSDLRIRTGADLPPVPTTSSDRTLVISDLPDPELLPDILKARPDNASLASDTPGQPPEEAVPPSSLRGKWWLIGLGLLGALLIGVAVGRRAARRPTAGTRSGEASDPPNPPATRPRRPDRPPEDRNR